MRFGMGEGFQFSSPYKWRYSKRFHRLFVYCSRLLIARDNSTGFTVAWMVVNANAGSSISFPRSFSSVKSVQRTIISDSSGPSKNNENGVSSYSNSSVTVGSNYWPSRLTVFGFS